MPRTMLGRVVGFSRALHSAGVEVNAGNLIDLCDSFQYISLHNRSDFYAAARATLVSRYDDLETFDEVFRAFWARPILPDDMTLTDTDAGGDPDLDVQADVNEVVDTADLQEEAEGEGESEEVGYSPDEALMGKDLAAMSDREIEQARKVIHEIVNIIANRRSRRRVPENRGAELDFRRTWRRNALYGSDGVELMMKRRRIKKTKLMLLCDVSGSMDCYSRFLIRFIYALKREIRDVEVGVFSTRMTAISRLLKTKGIEESLVEVADTVHDWAGGTDIGGCLREFNEQFARDMLHSRTVMIIVSDGWDRGDPDLMRQEMARLRKRVHKLMWLNPLLGTPGYQPLCLGMKTALPYLDYFLPAHNLESLIQLARTLRSVWK
ncbi:MAG: VWA domain-containing protein [Gemmatimonadetes bacterium]|nr:VWA domain-containing protein [Gemmatimonadota bacterium]MYB54839.1 VWA domain-containing protein [Gemmatimonadota bacterium]MYD61936.1 VWA domain-containing protein [Gemmatimonadota bacterium]